MTETPTDDMVQTFEFGRFSWPVSVLRRQTRRQVQDIDITPFVTDWLDDFRIPTIVRKPAYPINLEHPLIIVELSEPIDGETRLLIDGWHRVEYARAHGIRSLPAVVVGPDEEAELRFRDHCWGCGCERHVCPPELETGDDCYEYCTEHLDELGKDAAEAMAEWDAQQAEKATTGGEAA